MNLRIAIEAGLSHAVKPRGIGAKTDQENLNETPRPRKVTLSYRAGCRDAFSATKNSP